MENIERVPATPSQLDFAQLDVFAGMAAARPEEAADATAVINAVADATDSAVGFFAQFADPQNVNIRLMAEKNLHIIPM